MNLLQHEISPYLRQHANNPVNWIPYSRDALMKSKQENKMIFLSIGYSACHWCHVMAHESFENQEIASLLNENFISIKIDREERPDLDLIYQNVVQLMGERGGWPLSIFLTPDGNPFFGGTYFPIKNIYGLPSFKDVLINLNNTFSQQPKELNSYGEKVLDHLHEINIPRIDRNNIYQNYLQVNSAEKYEHLHSIIAEIEKDFDLIHGGFGKAPKFPNFPLMSFFINLNKIENNKVKNLSQLNHFLKKSLDKIRMGGIYDHIGGGFHRYAVDEAWTVPHFEKMLYDNALALIAYSDAYNYFKTPEYKIILKEIIEWVKKEMYSLKEGIMSTMDADSEGKEGTFYIWTYEELQNILSQEEFNLFTVLFDIKSEGNFEKNYIVLNQKLTLEQACKINIMKIENMQQQFNNIKENLYTYRDKRKYPGKDEKIITAWNGLILHGLYKTYELFKTEKFGEEILKLANDVSQYIQTNLINSKTGELHRISSNSRFKISGFLDDYTYLIQALLDKYEIISDEYLLQTIDNLIKFVEENFFDKSNSQYYFTNYRHDDIPVKPIKKFDMPLPSPNIVMLENLWRYSIIKKDSKYKSVVIQRFSEIIPEMQKFPEAMATALNLYLQMFF